jgi:peroxiredoxin
MKIMEAAPDFCLPDLDGKLHCLKDHRGKLVLITFWSADCPQSARVDEVLAAYEHRFGAQVVLMRIASNRNETPEEMKLAASGRGVNPVLWDEHQQVADLYAAQTTPHCYLVDADGLLRYRGAFDDVSFRQRKATQQYVIAALEALLDGRAPQTSETPPYGCSIVRKLPDFVLK